MPSESDIVRWPTVIASPRTDIIEDRAEEAWLDDDGAGEREKDYRKRLGEPLD